MCHTNNNNTTLVDQIFYEDWQAVHDFTLNHGIEVGSHGMLLKGSRDLVSKITSKDITNYTCVLITPSRVLITLLTASHDPLSRWMHVHVAVFGERLLLGVPRCQETVCEIA